MLICEEPLWSWKRLKRGSPTGATLLSSFENIANAFIAEAAKDRADCQRLTPEGKLGCILWIRVPFCIRPFRTRSMFKAISANRLCFSR
jgi:hypothetical protein